MDKKVVYVQAKFKPRGELRTVLVPTGEKRKGLLGEREVMKEDRRWVQTGFSDCEIDGESLARDIEQAILKLDAEGYEVSEIFPVTSGKYHFNYEINYSYGYGYSYTEGVVIIAKKTN